VNHQTICQSKFSVAYKEKYSPLRSVHAKLSTRPLTRHVTDDRYPASANFLRNLSSKKTCPRDKLEHHHRGGWEDRAASYLDNGRFFLRCLVVIARAFVSVYNIRNRGISYPSRLVRFIPHARGDREQQFFPSFARAFLVASNARRNLSA